jgi:hypothetical protein
MLKQLNLTEVKKWQDADSNGNHDPSLHYIAVTAQGAPGISTACACRLKQIDTVIS